MAISPYTDYSYFDGYFASEEDQTQNFSLTQDFNFNSDQADLVNTVFENKLKWTQATDSQANIFVPNFNDAELRTSSPNYYATAKQPCVYVQPSYTHSTKRTFAEIDTTVSYPNKYPRVAPTTETLQKVKKITSETASIFAILDTSPKNHVLPKQIVSYIKSATDTEKREAQHIFSILANMRHINPIEKIREVFFYFLKIVPLTLDELSDIFAVSTRTIHTYKREINKPDEQQNKKPPIKNIRPYYIIQDHVYNVDLLNLKQKYALLTHNIP